MVKTRRENSCRSLADCKPSNVSYHLEAKNAFPLRSECVLALEIAPNSIYVKNRLLFSRPVCAMVPGTWVTINCGRDEVLRALEATEGDWGTPSDSLLLCANGFGDLEVKSL